VGERQDGVRQDAEHSHVAASPVRVTLAAAMPAPGVLQVASDGCVRTWADARRSSVAAQVRLKRWLTLAHGRRKRKQARAPLRHLACTSLHRASRYAPLQ
jgi:hypothetical protein